MNKPWLIYTRVSTQDQAQEGASLPAQEEACRHYLQAMRITAMEVISDPGLSGKDLERPGIQRILERVRAGEVAGVLAWKLDRFTRCLRDLLDVVKLLDRHQVALASVQERIDTSGPMGRFTIALMGALAQLESEQIGERTSLGMQQRIKEGCWVGGHVPAGLVVEEGADGKRRLARHPIHAAAVAQCWLMVIGGHSLREVAAFLTTSQVPTRRSPKWSTPAVSTLLRNERYIGLVVDQDHFDRAQVAVEARRTPMNHPQGDDAHDLGGRPSSRVWPFAGLVVCGLCGRALVGTQCKGRGGKLYPYFRCTGRLKAVCTARDLPAEAYERFMLEQVSKIVNDGERFEAMFRKSAEALGERSAAEAKPLADAISRRGGIIHRRDRLIALATTGDDATARAYQPAISKAQVELEAVDLEIARLEGTQAAAAVAHQRVDEWMTALAQGLTNLDGLKPEAQASVLSTLVRQVRLQPEAVEIDMWTNPPENETARGLSSPGLSSSTGVVRKTSRSWLPGLGPLRTWNTVHFNILTIRGRSRTVSLAPPVAN